MGGERDDWTAPQPAGRHVAPGDHRNASHQFRGVLVRDLQGRPVPALAARVDDIVFGMPEGGEL